MEPERFLTYEPYRVLTPTSSTTDCAARDLSLRARDLSFVQAQTGVFHITAIKTVTLASSSRERPFSPEKIANTHWPFSQRPGAPHVRTPSIWGVRRTTGEEHILTPSTVASNPLSRTTASRLAKCSLKTPPRLS